MNKTPLAALAITLATGSVAQAFEADVSAVIDRYKAGKLVAMDDVAVLMRDSARWCYDNQGSSCAWSEIYLEVDDTDVSFELSNNWDVDIDYAFTDAGVIEDDRICQTGFNWIPNLRASHRGDDAIIGGRELRDFKLAMAEARPDLESYSDCFDYLYRGSDADQQVITLRQRQYVDGVHEPLNDVEVTLHFDAEDAAGLTLRE